jgi:multidrug efflux pump subunit AcrA (membrane-fusion protein)
MLRMAGVVAAVATPLWMALGPMPYTVRARAVIEPTAVRHLTAPFAGRIAAASCEEGQVVTAGQVLVQLHVSELEVERDRLRGAIAAGEVEADAARSADDHAKARILSARVDVDRAALTAVEDRIAKAVIVAPCDGFVLRGKPRELVGSTLAAVA